MGSTGKVTNNPSPIQSQAPQASSQTGLADNADSATIQKYYNDQYGITIGGSYFKDNLDTKVLARTSQVLDKLVQELGKDTIEEMGIRITSMPTITSNAYAQTNARNHKIGVNPKTFNSYDTLKALMHNDVKQKFHPPNSKAADIIVHEFGHNLEFLINERQNKGNMLNIIASDSGQVYSKAIVQAAYAEVKKENPSLYSTEKQARASISRYADSKWHGVVAYTECMAEAVADYGRNGANANPLSIKIWEGIKKALS